MIPFFFFFFLSRAFASSVPYQPWRVIQEALHVMGPFPLFFVHVNVYYVPFCYATPCNALTLCPIVLLLRSRQNVC